MMHEDHNGQEVSIGKKCVSVEADTNGKIGIVRDIQPCPWMPTKNHARITGQDMDPCAPGADLNKPHWSSWVLLQDLVVVD
jgi:hypothetical protein